jgi:putative spermidine/putrescine transport system substrate-binding protein
MRTTAKHVQFAMPRRRLLRALAAGVSTVSMVGWDAFMSAAVAQDAVSGTINFLTWGGAFGKGVREAFSDPFTQRTKWVVRDITPFNLGRFQTAMRHGNPEGFDLAWFNDEVDPEIAGAAGMLEPLNYAWLPDARRVIPGARQKYGAAPYVTLYQMSYNTNVCKTAPTSWKDFWDVERIPGPRSLGTWVCGVLEAALMADGVAPDKLYPLDENRAFKKLDKIRPHIRVFHDTQAYESVQQMLEQGEVAMVLTWATDTVAAHLSGKPVDVVYNQGFYFSPLVGIAKGTPKIKECHQYLNSFFQPQAEMAFVKAWPTSPADPSVYAQMPEREKAAAATGQIDKMVHFNVPYYRDNRARLQQKYDSWRIV